MNVIKWIGSCIIAILLVGAAVGVVILVASVATYIFIGVGILGSIALVTYGVWTMLSKK